uniref:Myb-like domain-containing protein n=1 Tax=Homalodisca liturata TaxID=320908 RepID=A0A1B6IA74_9HEMI
MYDKCKPSDSVCSLRRSKFEECDQTEITLRKVANVVTSPCQLKIYNSIFLVTDSEREEDRKKRKKKKKKISKIKTSTASNETTFKTKSEMDNITKISNGSYSFNSPLKCLTPTLVQMSSEHSLFNDKNTRKNKRKFRDSNPKPLKKRKQEELNTAVVQKEQSIKCNDRLVVEKTFCDEQTVDYDETDIEDNQLSAQLNFSGKKEKCIKTYRNVENQRCADHVEGESAEAVTKQTNNILNDEESSLKHINKCLSENVLTACDATSELAVRNDDESIYEDSYNQNSLLPSSDCRNDVETTVNVVKKSITDSTVGDNMNFDKSPSRISRKGIREEITGNKKGSIQSITSTDLVNISNKTGDCLKTHKKHKEEKLNTTGVQEEQSTQYNDKVVEDEVVNDEQIVDDDETDIENNICLISGDQLSVQPNSSGPIEELMEIHKGVENQPHIDNVEEKSVDSFSRQANKVFCNEENSPKLTNKCISEDKLSVQDATSEPTVENNDEPIEENSYNLDLDNQNSLLQTTTSRNNIDTTMNVKTKITTDNNTLGSESNFDELPEKISSKVNQTKISRSKKRTTQSTISVDYININYEASDCLQNANSVEIYENNVNCESKFLNQLNSSLTSDDTPNIKNKKLSKKGKRSCSPIIEGQFKKDEFKLNKRKVGSKSEKQLRNICKSKDHNHCKSSRLENEDESVESAYLSQSSLDTENGKDYQSSKLNRNVRNQFKIWNSTPRVPETSHQRSKAKINSGESSNNRKYVDRTINSSSSHIHEQSKSQSVLEETMENIQLHVINSEEELQRLKKLNIKITWELPKIHALDNGSHHMSLKKLRTILGPDSDLLCDDKFSSQEVKQIKRNWKKFCKIYGFKNPEMFMSSKQLYGYFPVKERLKFKQFLARKLPYRRLYSVYHKFMDIFAVKSRGRWKEKEDQLLLQLYHAYEEEEGKVKYGISRNTMLAKALQRTPMSIHRRLQVLFSDNEKEEKGVPGEIGWTPDLEGKVVYYLLKKLKYDSIEELRYATIPDEVWYKVANKLTLSHRQLINHWKYFLYPQLFARQAMLRHHLYIELICWFKKSEIQDWADVDWKDLSKRAGDLGPFYLYRCYRALTKNYVPKNLHTNFRACTIHMYKYLLPSLLRKETSYMLKRWRYNPDTRSLEKLEDDDTDCSFKIE